MIITTSKTVDKQYSHGCFLFTGSFTVFCQMLLEVAPTQTVIYD